MKPDVEKGTGNRLLKPVASLIMVLTITATVNSIQKTFGWREVGSYLLLVGTICTIGFCYVSNQSPFHLLGRLFIHWARLIILLRAAMIVLAYGWRAAVWEMRNQWVPSKWKAGREVEEVLERKWG